MQSEKINSFNLGSLIRASVLFWLSILFVIAVYVTFYFLDNHRPHFVWWIVTTTAMAITGFSAFWVYLKHLRDGKRRLLATSIFMMALSPIVLAAAFITQVNQAAHARDDMKINASTKVLGLWVSGYFEIEARCRYRRITDGKYVQLFDDGEVPNPQQLVDNMDQHIEAMSKMLGRPTPKSKTAWIRGPLFGHSGRAIMMFAICNTETPEEELVYVDRHEVAHTTMLGVVNLRQEPPMLLAEGWAQANSVDRNEMTRGLNDARKYEEHVTIEEMVRAPRYGQSVGPAYSIGGPFTTFLVEKHGGAVFANLYEDAKRKSFVQDFESITNTSLAETETQFWAWLENEMENLSPLQSDGGIDTPKLSFSRESDRAKWDELCQRWNDGAEEKLPSEIAIEISLAGDTPAKIRAIVEGGELWGSCEYEQNDFDSEYMVESNNQQGHVYHSDETRETEVADIHFESIDLQIRNWLRMGWLGSPEEYLPLSEGTFDPNGQYTIESIETDLTENKTNCWKVVVSYIGVDENSQQYRSELLLNPDDRFQVIHAFHDWQPDEYEISYSRKVINGVIFHELKSDKKWGLKRVTIRSLDDSEIKAIKEKCEQIVALAPRLSEAERKRIEWRNAIASSPWLWGFAWPIIAIALLGIDLFCESTAVRRKFSFE